MDPSYVVFIILVIGTVIGAARLGEKVYDLRRRIESPATRLLLNSWLIWCLFTALFVLFFAFIVFANRIFPGVSHNGWYRPLMVAIFGVLTWGSLGLLELAWRKLTR